jgi:hypothetical protein
MLRKLRGAKNMAEHHTHKGHAHTHGAGCGHRVIQHSDHRDYLHEGHLHRAHGDHVDECSLEAGGSNPVACTPSHACTEHDQAHAHASGCGHDIVLHADHVDFLVGSHLHHPHGGHYDDHGVV